MNKEARYADVVIAGGGASGLAAAIELGMRAPELSVLVIEKMDEPGRKLRATGSGRCNITNTDAEGYAEIMKFFAGIGLVTRTYENGLVYPHSESAADAADLLISRAKELGAAFACGERVEKIQRCAHGSICSAGSGQRSQHAAAAYKVESVRKEKDGEHRIITESKYVIMAMGGKSGPMFGTTGDGYAIARSLGHSIVTPVPALAGIECAEWDRGRAPDAVALAGTRTMGVVTLYKNDRGIFPRYDGLLFDGTYAGMEPVFSEYGEIQFTKYGLSGICVMNMTRHMRFDRSKGESLNNYLIKTDIFPDGEFIDHIHDTLESRFAQTSLRDMMCTLVKPPVAEYITKETAVDRPVSEMSPDDIRLACEAVHGLEFHPIKIRGWKDAQVTMGGVSLKEIDAAASESKLAGGLYICGELADMDFQCGGFNLSNAWLTGLHAAADIAAKEKR